MDHFGTNAQRFPQNVSMAKIIWKKKAEILLADHIAYARQEFGVTTARRWMNRVNKIEARLRRYPESYTPEPFVLNKRHLYRSALMMKNFKLVYVYYPSSDTVRIVDIWDMRMNPEKLKKRI